MSRPLRDGITDVPGIRVGHWTDRRAATGCTVVLCEKGAVGGVDVRGGAPGTRETDLLRPGTLVQGIHAVLLTGGSAWGLDAASGVMRYLEERGVGWAFGAGPVPVVAGAVLYDLRLGRGDVRPDAEAGYRACRAARTGAVAQGSVGAGTGATVGKALGMERCLKGGLGTASEAMLSAAGDLVVGALVAVNCFGEVVDPASGQVIAGPRAEGGGFVSTVDILRGDEKAPWGGESTTLGVIVTNARLTEGVCLSSGLRGPRWPGARHTARPHYGRWRRRIHDGDGPGSPRAHALPGSRGPGCPSCRAGGAESGAGGPRPGGRALGRRVGGGAVASFDPSACSGQAGSGRAELARSW